MSLSIKLPPTPISSLSQMINNYSSQKLQPIYAKVKQLKKQQITKQQMKKQKQLQLSFKNINFYKQVNILLNCDRGQKILKKRSLSAVHIQKLNENSFSPHQTFRKTFQQFKMSNKKNKTFKIEQLKMKPRGQRLKNFLLSHKSQNPQSKIKQRFKDQQKQNNYKNGQPSRRIQSVHHPQISQDQAKQIQQQIRSFSPIRPLSRMSGASSSVIEKKLSSIQKSSSYRGTISRQNSFRTSSKNTIGFPSRAGNKKTNSPTKYLRKGTRVRQLLLKQLNVVDFDNNGEQQMAYLKQYDQWVPASLANLRKQQLQKYMQILVGKKKQQVEIQRDTKFKMIYL